jgi:hypothetical protein
MGQKTLSEQFYATRDTEFDGTYWNKFVSELQARFAALDSIKISWDTIVQEGLSVAIDRINEVLGPAAERIQNIAALGFLSVSSSTSRTIGAGINNFMIDAGDARDLFVPTPWVAITREADPLDYAIGQVTFFDRASGSMDIQVVYIEGDAGPHNDWTISAVAGQALAQATILGDTFAARDAALASKDAAVASASGSAASAATANGARSATEGFRDEVNNRIAPPGPTVPALATLGRLWFDGTLTRVYDGSTWAPVLSSTLGGLRFAQGTFGASPSGVITVGGGFTTALVFVNGKLLKAGTGYTAASPTVTVLAPVVGDEYFVWAYKALDATDYYTKEETGALVSAVDAKFAEKGAQPGDVKFTRSATVPAGWMKLNGAAVSRSAYPELDAAIYVGDIANSTAIDGYRCTNPASPSTTRSTSGGYLALPDYRGEFIRAWDDGRGVDVGRVLGSAQGSANLSHNHTGTTGLAGNHQHRQKGSGSPGALIAAKYDLNLTESLVQDVFTEPAGEHAHPFTTNSSGGTEARPRNVANLAIIKF